MENIEIWKDIKGYEGYYQVSNLGRVKSLDRYINNNGTKVLKKGKIIKSNINDSGYLTLRLHKNNKRKETFIHKLIAEYFIDNYENKLEVNHIDHNKLNNSIENLEWCTRKENINKMLDFYNKRKIINYCIVDNCENKTSAKNKKCIKCSRIISRKVNRPSDIELIKLLKNNSFVKIGKIFGVSDNSVRKWCKNYNIPVSKKELELYLLNF